MLKKINCLLSGAFCFGVASMLLFSTVGFAQGASSGSQLQMLENLSPEQREQVLRRLAESNDSGSKDAKLKFPEVIKPLETGAGEDGSPQIFSGSGQPLLNSERLPVYLTDELLKSLETEGPEDWLADPEPFFEQDIALKPFGYGLNGSGDYHH